MFCYQKNFSNPTLPVDEAQFWALVKATQWNENIDKYRETHDAALKRKLPAFIFQATFDETTSKAGKLGQWRKQAATRLTGLVVMDIDHVEDPKALFDSWGLSNSKEPRNQGKIDFPLRAVELNLPKFSDLKGAECGVAIPDSLDKKSSLERILLVYITPSGKGLKVVFKADVAKGNLIDNQHAMAKLLGVEVDESCKDASRMSFICKESDILYLDNELFTYENPEFGEKYDAEYHAGHSQAKGRSAKSAPSARETTTSRENNNLSQIPQMTQIKELVYHGVPYSKIVEAWLGDKKVEPGDRHRTSLVLADHLRYITDNDPVLIEQILRETPFVKDIVEERNEDVAQTVQSAQGYEFLKGIPRRMQNALKAAGAEPKTQPRTSALSSLPMMFTPCCRWTSGQRSCRRWQSTIRA